MKKGLVNFGLCLLMASTVISGSQLHAFADTQGSASWKPGTESNQLDLYVKLVDSEGDMITASQIDVMLVASSPESITSVSFEFDEAWDRDDIKVKSYDYDEDTGKLTLIIATDGKSGIMKDGMGIDNEEVKAGTITVESTEPVRAVISESKAISDGVIENVPSIHGIEATVNEKKIEDLKEEGTFVGTIESHNDDDEFTVEITGTDNNFTQEYKMLPEDDGVFEATLEYGKYTATVTEMPTDYFFEDEDDSSFSFEIDSPAPVEHTWSPSIAQVAPPVTDYPVNYTLVVKDNEGNRVPGVTIRLNGGGLTNRSYTSDPDGEITVEDVTSVEHFSIVYDFTITDVPEGYEGKQTTGQIIVSEAGATAFDIQINKKSTLPEVPVVEPKDVTVMVKDNEGNPVKGARIQVVVDGIGKVSTTDSKGQAMFEDLMPGEYEVTILSVPDGYEIVTAKATLTVSEDGSTKLDLTVKKVEKEPVVETGDISITVKDEKLLPVKDVKLQIKGADFDKTFMTDGSGKVSVKGLSYGSYTVIVLSVPKGYEITEKTKTFIISKDSGSSISIGIKKIEEEKPVEKTKNVTLVMKDQAGKPISGVKVRVTGTGFSKVLTSDKDGKILVEGLKEGDYSVEVLEAPSGYTLPSGKKDFKVSESGTTDFTVSITKKEESKPSSGNSSSGVSGGYSGGSSSGSSSSSSTSSTKKEEYASVVNGTWTYDAATDKWTLNNHMYKNRWVYVFNGYASAAQGKYDWFYFDKDGNMLTGWFTDSNGQTFYLHNTSDGTRGAMETGWAKIDGKWYYFHETSDGTKGHLLKATKTPDGYTVNADGAWTVDGVVVTQ